MSHSLVTPSGEVERAMAPIFEAVIGSNCPPGTRFKDSDFERIGSLLKQLGTPGWSVRPRTYAILKVIGGVKYMKSFIDADLLDIAIPYDDKKIARVLAKKEGAKFIEHQYLVMTDAYDLEKAGGRHQHLDHDADAHFVSAAPLGSGGFGQVDLVRSRLSLKEYARKRVLRSKTDGISSITRELASLKRLDHDHLIKILGSYTDPRYVGIIMEQVAESNLEEYLAQSPFPAPQKPTLRSFYGSLSSAVAYLHREKVRHKDLKPANVLVKNSKILITDFGAALDWSEHDKSTTRSSAGQHTPAYKAPEVEDWQPRNSSTDVYSLGLIFMEMTTILKGETLHSRAKHFSKNGNRSGLHRTNLVASNSWQQYLENKSPDDNQPLQWCKVMTQPVPENRIKADALWKKIYTCQDKYRYFPICCDENQTVCDDGEHDQATVHQPKATALKPTLSGATLKPSLENKNLAIPARGPTPNDETRLFDAAEKGNLVMVTLLLQQGSNIEARDSNGRTPLIMAAEWGNSTIITYLLNLGADIDAHDGTGWNALHYAAFYGWSYSCQILLDRGSGLETQSNEGSCALHLAVKHGNERTVRTLLEAGADINRETFSGWTALMESAKKGSEDIALLLLNGTPESANIESVVDKGMSILHLAAEHGHPNLVALFIDRGLEVDRRTDLGWTAFHFAADQNEMGAAWKLLEFAPDMQAMTSSGSSPLHLAARSGSEDVGLMLVDFGVNIDALDAELLTPLHQAALGGKPRMLAMLLAKGANRMPRTCYEFTPLQFTAFDETEDLARRTGKLECARLLLLEPSVDIDAKDQNGETTLHRAATRGAIELIKLLLNRGANINAQANSSYTTLHAAIIASKEDAVALLLARGADVHIGDGIAMSLAATQGGQISIVRLLVKYGASLEGHEEFAEFLNMDEEENVNNIPLASETSKEDQEAINKLLAEDEELQFAVASHSFPGSSTSSTSVSTTRPVIMTPQDSREENETPKIDEDDAVIERLCADGFDLALATEVYSLCSKNEVEARGALLEMYEAFIGSKTFTSPGSLQDAVSKGDMAMLKMILALGGDVNEINNKCKPEQTALMCAAFKNDEESISVLVEHAANVEVYNRDGNTALHFAAEAGSIGAAKLLLEYGADIEGKNKKGWTPVGCAAPGIKELLEKLSKGKGVLITPQVTPLSSPLPLPSSPIKQQPSGKLPKKSDMKKPPPPIPKKSAELLKRFSSLVTASQELTKSVDAIVVAQANDSKTTISTFQSTMNPKLTIRVARLPKSFDQVEKPFQSKPISPSNIIPPRPKPKTPTSPPSIKISPSPQHSKPPVSPPNIKKPPTTPKPKISITNLLMAVTHGTILQLVAFLKTSPESLNTQDTQGNTPLHSASSSGHETKVMLLLNYEADPSIANSIGNTPLHKAAQMGHYEVVKLLLGSNAKPDVKNKDGDTPRGVAAFYGRGAVLKLLLAFGGGAGERERDELRECARKGKRLGAAEDDKGYVDVLKVLGES